MITEKVVRGRHFFLVFRQAKTPCFQCLHLASHLLSMVAAALYHTHTHTAILDLSASQLTCMFMMLLCITGFVNIFVKSKKMNLVSHNRC